MKTLHPHHEKKLLAAGYATIAGMDEAGRGPWAGPVVAACIVFNDQAAKNKLFKINDSKKLTSKNRERCFKWLIENFDYGIGIVSHDIIDQINILNATKQAMMEAIGKLSSKIDYLLIDAVKLKSFTSASQESIIHGDQKVWSIAAASIIAKVTRDRLMIDYHQLYPQYGFDRHKGYGTKWHQKMLKQYGPCPIHRKSYAPIKLIMEHKNIKT